MQMPMPGEFHERLERLVGSWIGDETIHPTPFDPQGGAAKGLVENRAALDGWIVVQDYVQQRGGKTSYQGHGVFAYDPAAQLYRMHWFDTMGGPQAIYSGRFEDHVLVLANQNPHGHARATFDFGKPGAYSFAMHVSPDGAQWWPFLEGVYRRR